jgi:hypothetical protein
MYMTGFDEAYARYLAALKKLDQADEITEKNLLFRQLTQQLSDLEQRLNSDSLRSAANGAEDAGPGDFYLRDHTPCSMPPKHP